MPETADIPVSSLLLDVRNARLKEEQPSQQDAILEMAKKQKKQLIALAKDIVENGLDPTTLPAVVPTKDQKKRYIVLEGNRRLVALKALETPSIVTPALSPGDQTTIKNLAKKYAKNPISEITCALFDTEADANHWIMLRHTGQNQGAGLVEWGPDEQDRFMARHGVRSPEGQVLDFVATHGDLSKAAQKSSKGILTNLGRLLGTPDVRERLGVEVSDGLVYSLYPRKEIAKSLTHVVEELKTGQLKVSDIYYAEDRIKYAMSIPSNSLPDSETRLDTPNLLADVDDSGLANGNRKSKKTTRKRKKAEQVRTALIPKICQLDIRPPRINAIYIELLTLNVDAYPNSASVMLRVFLELSIDHYIMDNALMSETDRRSEPLAKRLKVVSADLLSKKLIDKQLSVAIERIADSQFVVAASTVTFNQYVHNPYVFPKATELRMAWDEIQPLMERLWPES